MNFANRFGCNYFTNSEFCCLWILIYRHILDDRRTVKNIPKYAPAQFYIDNVLPRVKEKKIMALKPFVDRLG